MSFEKKAIIFSIILLVTIKIAAQEKATEVNQFKNQIGIEISDIIDGTIQLKYERLLGKHISVGLGIGIKDEEGIIKLSGLDREQLKTGDIAYSGFKVIPEIRYYLNRTQQYAMDGFYFGVYLKYSNFNSDLDGTYSNDVGDNFTIAFDADIKVTSVGFMVGYKWAISKRFAIDFLIAGPGVGTYNFSLKNTQGLPDEFYDDFNDALDQYSLFDLLDGDFRFKATDEKSKFILPSFRYGISLNYSF
ncbi:DUF3575 domain-containing protein [Lacinutrix jangbogonensis]|uniref:DUF3575 domain-containing protein n=1 Tax=Lacinutrix jangbogonensis TaxID=1469557 RepID=UPI00053E7C8E|nr:DUF3575 domain-containing protein [Lacinutrix jangbogonensis]